MVVRAVHIVESLSGFSHANSGPGFPQAQLSETICKTSNGLKAIKTDCITPLSDETADGSPSSGISMSFCLAPEDGATPRTSEAGECCPSCQACCAKQQLALCLSDDCLRVHITHWLKRPHVHSTQDRLSVQGPIMTDPGSAALHPNAV